MRLPQLEALFRPLNPVRIKKSPHIQGSYLEGWDVIAHLSRIFGPLNWDKHVLSLECVQDMPVYWKDRNGNEKSGFDVTYRATVRLVIRHGPAVELATKISEDVGTGTASHQPDRGGAHDQAIKTAVTDALKRCAKDLGNQFGLSLYNKGSADSVLGRSLAHPELLPQAEPEEAE